MNMPKVGKLYRSKKHFFLLFPDSKAAVFARHGHTILQDHDLHADEAAYWSRRCRKPVSYTEKNIPLLILNTKIMKTKPDLIEVLAGDKKGWIVFKDWANLKQIRR